MNGISKPMLAEKVALGKIQYPILATPKYDGVRCLKVGGRALSRSFKPLPNTWVRCAIEQRLPDGVDGELIVPSGTFQDTTSAFMTINGVPMFEYHVFDFVPGSLEKPYCLRMADLKSLTRLGITWLKIVLPVHAANETELLDYEAHVLEQGFEGVIIRSPNSPYKCGRSTVKEGFMLKLKRFEDSEATVWGFDERMHNANEAKKNELGYTEHSTHKSNMVPTGMLGALRVQDVKAKSAEHLEFKIGSGFTEEQRKEIWNNREKYIGKIVKYKYQPSGVKDLPRFPIFLGWRHPDDA